MNNRNSMRPKAVVAGRSFVFNLFFVILNVASVVTILFGFHPFFEDHSLWLKILGFTLFAISVGGIILFQGRLMMNNCARVLVGALFIVSGLIKANDPIGFSYKLEEYFEDGALAYRIKEWFGMPEFSLESLIPLALGLSIFICVVEIVLGVLLVFRQKMKTVTILVLAMMMFFTFLTWHTANCYSGDTFTDRDQFALNSAIGKQKVQMAKSDKKVKVVSLSGAIVIDEIKTPQCVNDCGCFGDAMKGSLGRSLSPSESFWKDILLLYFSIWLVVAAFKRNTIDEENRTRFWVPALILVALLSWLFTWVFPVLFAFVAFFVTLWLLRKDRIKGNNHWSVIGFVTILTILLISYVLMYEPIKDYRPYAVGSNLKMKMNDGIDGKVANILVYKNKRTGQIRKYDDVAYVRSRIWENPNWVFRNKIEETIVEGKLPSISLQFSPFISYLELSDIERELDFVTEKLSANKKLQVKIEPKDETLMTEWIDLDGFVRDSFPEDRYTILDTLERHTGDVTTVEILEDILKAKKIIILTVSNLKEANWSNVEQYKKILSAAKRDKIPMIMLVSANANEIRAFRKKYDFEIPIFTNDETELKAIARSNPSLMILKKGIVKGKYAHRATPAYDWLKKNVL
jgi:uncharacterized membrane protein YphA (DoxX/SURF4 family)